MMQRRPELAASIPEITIEPPKGWQLVDWKELLEYRDLFYFLVWRDVKVLYKQTILGFTWAIIRPVFSMIVFSVVFGRLARVGSDGVPYPLFSLAGLIPWTYFSSSMTNSTSSLITNANMLTKVYFPRVMIPITPALASLVDFGISFVILFVMMAWYRIWPGVSVIYLPILAFLMLSTASGIGMWLSALAVRYRDVKHATEFISQVLMYAAPVVWPVSLIPGKFRMLYGLYPMVGVIEGFRSALLRANPMPWDLILIGGGSSLLIALSGSLYFRRMERTFADVA